MEKNIHPAWAKKKILFNGLSAPDAKTRQLHLEHNNAWTDLKPRPTRKGLQQ